MLVIPIYLYSSSTSPSAPPSAANILTLKSATIEECSVHSTNYDADGAASLSRAPSTACSHAPTLVSTASLHGYLPCPCSAPNANPDPNCLSPWLQVEA